MIDNLLLAKICVKLAGIKRKPKKQKRNLAKLQEHFRTRVNSNAEINDISINNIRYADHTTLLELQTV